MRVLYLRRLGEVLALDLDLEKALIFYAARHVASHPLPLVPEVLPTRLRKQHYDQNRDHFVRHHRSETQRKISRKRGMIRNVSLEVTTMIAQRYTTLKIVDAGTVPAWRSSPGSPICTRSGCASSTFPGRCPSQA
jgi:hypothetical protein